MQNRESGGGGWNDVAVNGAVLAARKAVPDAPADIVTRLRDATGEAHRRLEERLDIVRRLASPDGRCRLVARFCGLHEGAEDALASVLDGLEGLDFSGRRRGRLLRADLDVLAADTAPSACPIEPPASAGWALGFLYVLEGSTLGGKVIRREMEGQGGTMTGLGFLDPYGAATGDRWRAFLAVLRREAEDARAADEIVRGAVDGFAAAESWLCGPSIPAA